ncbi:MAG TPA: pantoate--beta-alanine ligase [Bacteroidales bacterium]|nr:pantoate--beta-alanine ligase [Bacteroidales bacterium]HCI54456.1 pantoate--beta-alanine ligase [Bacteroidales bacterium]HOU95222.1 pantoate--beta-alanine ligase [Bacteroidales bacterium]HQG35989.1 pantoate--beta-alanine ligase [Bacteroidales bacterium]HQG52947.1 pantoate--beta-alanine ligase [Bacteroidales bacterium]
MKVYSTVKELQECLDERKARPIGFVPTMGALHKGHISLIEASLKECPVTVVSIFVNPTQFNDRQDLENYPRMPENDRALLSKILREEDIVFIPSEKEIYPGDEREVVFEFRNLDKVMEGVHRPDHFKGVVQVVSRLFDIVNPDLAFFGQKDFQQLTIIKELVRQQGRNIKVISCPIVREADGLAMSSRNLLIEPSIRDKAGIIYKTLSEAALMINTHEISEIKDYVNKCINNTNNFELEYFEIADDTELKLVETRSEMEPGKRYFGCIAVRAGKIRLIDNIEFNCPISKG